MKPELGIAVLTMITSAIGYFETRYRMKNLSTRVKAEVLAKSKLAAAIVIADAVLAAAKIKADAKERRYK